MTLPATASPTDARAANSDGDVAGRSYQRTTGVLMTSITRMLRTYFDRRARSVRLTRSQWLAMNRLSLQRGITAGKLAELMEVEHITASRLIGNLEAMGWVVRRPDPADRRQRLVHLTEAGLPILEQINQLGMDTEEKMFADLSPAELRELSRLLDKVHATISRMIGEEKD